MTANLKTFLVIAAAAALLAAEPALARQNRGGRRTRSRADVILPSTSPEAGAKLSIRLRTKSHGRSEFRVSLERASDGLSPELWIADAAGVLTDVGALVPDRSDPGEYRLRLRVREGDPLPAGATSLADLAGRAFEVREGAGVIVAGTIPALGTNFRDRDGDGDDDRRGRGSDDGPNHDVGDDHGGDSGSSGSDDGPNHDVGDDHGGDDGTDDRGGDNSGPG